MYKYEITIKLSDSTEVFGVNADDIYHALHKVQTMCNGEIIHMKKV